jgi:hypothetical protein
LFGLMRNLNSTNVTQSVQASLVEYAGA